MVVAQWINSQYLFSTLDNVAFGGGSKITKNITGKVGIMQRPVRLVFVATTLFALAWGQLAGGAWPEIAFTFSTWTIGILAVTAAITAARRAHFIYHELAAPEANVEPIRSAHPDDETLEQAAS
jgi:hypothetical protein